MNMPRMNVTKLMTPAKISAFHEPKKAMWVTSRTVKATRAAIAKTTAYTTL